jgi:hypothetical protein
MKARTIRELRGRCEIQGPCLREMADDVVEETQEAAIDYVEVEVGKDGMTLMGHAGEISRIELRKLGDLEQEVREETGLLAKPVMAHPDGYKKNGPDWNNSKFDKSQIVRRMRDAPAKPVGVSKTIRLRRSQGLFWIRWSLEIAENGSEVNHWVAESLRDPYRTFRNIMAR